MKAWEVFKRMDEMRDEAGSISAIDVETMRDFLSGLSINTVIAEICGKTAGLVVATGNMTIARSLRELATAFMVIAEEEEMNHEVQ